MCFVHQSITLCVLFIIQLCSFKEAVQYFSPIFKTQDNCREEQFITCHYCLSLTLYLLTGRSNLRVLVMSTYSLSYTCNVVCFHVTFSFSLSPELLYEDVFSVWETIWAAKYISSPHFVLFIALALVEFYRDIILDNNMDFTDIIKFFNGLYFLLEKFNYNNSQCEI